MKQRMGRGIIPALSLPLLVLVVLAGLGVVAWAVPLGVAMALAACGVFSRPASRASSRARRRPR